MNTRKRRFSKDKKVKYVYAIGFGHVDTYHVERLCEKEKDAQYSCDLLNKVDKPTGFNRWWVRAYVVY